MNGCKCGSVTASDAWLATATPKMVAKFWADVKSCRTCAMDAQFKLHGEAK